jgi:hypothetical protein
MRGVAAALAMVALALAACGAPTPSELSWPIDPDAVTDPDRMAVQPAAAAPGEVVGLTFPTGQDRGILFAIDRPAAEGWRRVAYLVSDANGGAPSWHRADEEMFVEMVGIAGPGPDRVVIPDGLAAGPYRICTGNALENLCAPFEVIAP